MLSFLPRDVFDEIWDLIGSVPKGFPSYSYNRGAKNIYAHYLMLLYLTCKTGDRSVVE